MLPKCPTSGAHTETEIYFEGKWSRNLLLRLNKNFVFPGAKFSPFLPKKIEKFRSGPKSIQLHKLRENLTRANAIKQLVLPVCNFRKMKCNRDLGQLGYGHLTDWHG